MVLQKSPMKANIWGYLRNSAVNSQVSVELNNKMYNAVYIKGSNKYVQSVKPVTLIKSPVIARPNVNVYSYLLTRWLH